MLKAVLRLTPASLVLVLISGFSIVVGWMSSSNFVELQAVKALGALFILGCVHIAFFCLHHADKKA